MKTEKAIILLKGYREGGIGLQVEGPFATPACAETFEKELWEEEWFSFFYDGCGGDPFPGLDEARRRLGNIPKRSEFWTSIKEVEVPATDHDALLYENQGKE